MMLRLAALALALAIPALASAQTQPEYTADQILEHFRQPQAAAGDCTGSDCLPKGGTRAVCIGTASECAAQQAAGTVATAAAAPPEGFDLLVTFELGSAELSAQARVNLQEFARAMRDPALADTTFNVDGHTDARGSDAFNQGLSERRAESVVKFLELLGIERSRLHATGYGESRLRDAANPNADINRRVEARLRAR